MAAVKESFERVEVEREGATVTIALQCVDEYAAMLVRGSMERHLLDGYLKIEITPRKTGARFYDA